MLILISARQVRKSIRKYKLRTIKEGRNNLAMLAVGYRSVKTSRRGCRSNLTTISLALEGRALRQSPSAS